MKYASLIGDIYITVKNDMLIGISKEPPSKDILLKETPMHQDICNQLDAYFKGEKKAFDILIEPKTTPFSKRVYEALKEIPYGHQMTYGELAKKIGQPKASRAVGGALNKNPIMIVLPCHRVIGKNHDLVGFRGGLDLKKTLLDLEKKNMV